MNKEITVQDLKARLDNNEELLIIDVREEWEYEEFNIGARLIPLTQLLTNLSQFEDQKESEIIIHCKSGGRSAQAQQFMIQQGFKNVVNVIGGMAAWQEMAQNT